MDSIIDKENNHLNNFEINFRCKEKMFLCNVCESSIEQWSCVRIKIKIKKYYMHLSVPESLRVVSLGLHPEVRNKTYSVLISDSETNIYCTSQAHLFCIL